MNVPTNPTISSINYATPRSGSSLLCEALRSTGLAGFPGEYFGPMHVDRWSGQWGSLSEAANLQKVLSYATGANGVFSLKVMSVVWQNFASYLQQEVGNPDLDERQLLNACFPGLRFIWITRRDKVRQAISWRKFIQDDDPASFLRDAAVLRGWLETLFPQSRRPS